MKFTNVSVKLTITSIFFLNCQIDSDMCLLLFSCVQIRLTHLYTFRRQFCEK